MGSWWSSPAKDSDVKVSPINVRVVNETPKTLSFSTQDRGYTQIDSGRSTSYKEDQADAHIRIRPKNHSGDSFSYKFDTKKGDTSFILRENKDRSQIQMHCTSENDTCSHPNPGKFLQTCHFWTTLYRQKYAHPNHHSNVCLFNISFKINFAFAVIKTKKNPATFVVKKSYITCETPHTVFIF